VKRRLLLLRGLLGTRLGFRRLLGSFLGRHIQKTPVTLVRMPFFGESVMRLSGIRREKRPLKALICRQSIPGHKKITCGTFLRVLILMFVSHVNRNSLYFMNLLISHPT
jgi:hypothetical protein